MATSVKQREDVGKRIMNARIREKLSYEEMATLCGVSEMTVRRWESGAHAPKAGELIAISKATSDTSIDWLLFGVNHTGAKQADNEPIRRGQWRDAPALANDFAAAVLRACKFRSTGGVSFRPEQIDFDAVVADVALALQEHDAAYLAYMREVIRQLSLEAATEHALLAIRTLLEPAGSSKLPENKRREIAEAAVAQLRAYSRRATDDFDSIASADALRCRYLRASPSDARSEPNELQAAILRVIRAARRPNQATAEIESYWSGDRGLARIKALRKRKRRQAPVSGAVAG